MRKIKEVEIVSPANIAFIKYWGRRDNNLVLPYNSSFSMNLSDCKVQVKLELFERGKQQLFIKDYGKKRFVEDLSAPLQKVKEFFKKVKNRFGIKKDYGFKIFSSLNFPRQAGIASSAAFFSALALGFSQVLDINLSTKELSILARLSGSGSAARSIPNGFVLWHKGDDSESSFAESIAKSDFWDLRNIVVILNTNPKRTTSYSGHKNVLSSGLFQDRLSSVEKRLKEMLKAFKKQDLEKFGNLLEEEAISMHSVMMTQSPPLFYWSGKTLDILRFVASLRKKGIPVYFTIDAGENVHLITTADFKNKVIKELRNLAFIKAIIVNQPSEGARVIKKI